ncbi:hypothetical protein SprV_0702327900 [Sparganum proliferum]
MLVEQMDSENSSQVVQVSEPWVQAQSAENGSILLSQVLRALTNLPETNSGAVAVANLAQPQKSKSVVVGQANLPTSQTAPVSQTHVLIPVSALSSNRSLEALGATVNTRPLLLQTTSVPPTPTTSTPAQAPLLSSIQMPTAVAMPNGGLSRVGAVNNVLPAALVNSTTANLIAQLANSVSAGMLTVAQSSLLTHPQDVSSTLTELGQLLSTISSLTSTLRTSLDTLISMTSIDSSVLTSTSTSISTTVTPPQPPPVAPLPTGRLITLRVIPNSTGSNFVGFQQTVMKAPSTVSTESRSSEVISEAKSSNPTCDVPSMGQVQPAFGVNTTDSVVVNQLPTVSTPPPPPPPPLPSLAVAVKPVVNPRKRPPPIASRVSEGSERHPAKSASPLSEEGVASVPVSISNVATSSSPVSSVASSGRTDERTSRTDSNVAAPVASSSEEAEEVTQPSTVSASHPTPEAQKLAAAAPAVSNWARKNLYICPMEACRKSFIKRSKLRDHLCGHTGERPYVCSLCKARFIRSCDLRRHNLSHSKAENSVPDASSLHSVS